jgi:hypothetical protein
VSERKDEKRFLEALDPAAAGAGSAVGAASWPEAVARAPFVFDAPIVAQWLDDDRINDYLARVRPAGKSLGAAPPLVCDLPRDWHADSFPLLLCEFLAYKAALVYRDPKAIRADLLGASPRTGAAFCPGITKAAFFDSTARYVRSAGTANLADAAARPSAPRTFVRTPSVRYGDTQALAFALNGTGYIILRGSDRFEDVDARLKSALSDHAYPRLSDRPQSLVGSPRPARVTRFAIAWGVIAMDLERWVHDEMRAGRVERLVFSGHGFGGALAILAAYHVAKGGICPVHAVVTFAAPSVGGNDFKNAYENPVLGLKDRTLRLEAPDDWSTIRDHGVEDRSGVGHLWRLTKRPLRPWWEMLAWAPMTDPAVSAERRRAAVRRERSGPAGREAPAAGDGVQAGFSGHNRPVEAVQRTWRDFARAWARTLAKFWTPDVSRGAELRNLERDYALYLSTLSYRKIRAHHAALARLRLMTRRSFERKDLLMEKAFRLANEDLAGHLRFVRGGHPGTFRHLANMPVRVVSPADLKRLEKSFAHYIM